MNLIFFQNCISPHQIPYIKECLNDDRVKKVILVVPRIDYTERLAMGWENNDNLIKDTGIKLYLRPEDITIKQLFQLPNSYFFFSGIRADKYIFKWFQMSINYKIKRGIITEPPNVYKSKPLWLHYIRFYLQDKKFIPYINYVFAFGPLAVSYYNSWSKKWKVIPFAYCTAPKKESKEIKYNNNINLVFVGSLTKNKNVQAIFTSMQSLSSNTNLHIIGDGNEYNNLKKTANSKQIEKQVFFHGKQSMEKVHSMILDYDILILPSHYDGWGAVINEALQSGLYVICSNKCGAQALLTDSKIGKVFKTQKELSQILKECCIHIEDIRKNREKRLSWSKNISGEKIAKYFIDNLVTNQTITEPWKEKI